MFFIAYSSNCLICQQCLVTPIYSVPFLTDEPSANWETVGQCHIFLPSVYYPYDPAFPFVIFGKPEPAVFGKDFFVIHGSLCLAVAVYFGSLDMLTWSPRLRSAKACLTSCSKLWNLSESI